MYAEQIKITDFTGLNGGSETSGVKRGEFSATFGLISALVGSRFTVNVPGLKPADNVLLNCISQPPLGMNISNARVSATDTLEVLITTSIALGLTLGALNFRLTAFRA